jgi:hypothetical protein
MQAIEAIKLLTGIGEPLKGKLMVCDFSDMRFLPIDIFRRPGCSACEGEVQLTKAKERLTWLCGQNTVNVNPPRLVEASVDQLQERLKRYYKILIKSPIVVVFRYDGGVEVSLFYGGRMLIKNVKNEDTALNVYKDVWKKAGLKP